MVRATATRPFLVDGPALGLTAASALLACSGHPVASAIIALVGAGVKEHVPVFAALAAWSPWPLVGLAVTAVLWLTRTPGPSSHPSQEHPFVAARAMQAERLLTAQYSLMPWGVCLAAAFAPTVPMLASLAVGYGMLFVAVDSSRVFQWAAIPVCLAAAAALPDQWLIPAVAIHFFVPRAPVI